MHELESIIWYMFENKVHSAPVLARMIVDNAFQNQARTKEQKELYMPFGPEGVFYQTVHGIRSADHVFGSKQELLESL